MNKKIEKDQWNQDFLRDNKINKSLAGLTKIKWEKPKILDLEMKEGHYYQHCKMKRIIK